MYVPEWKTTRARLQELAGKAEQDADEERALVYQALRRFGDQMEEFRDKLLRVEEQVQSLTKRTVALELSIHEEVE